MPFLPYEIHFLYLIFEKGCRLQYVLSGSSLPTSATPKQLGEISLGNSLYLTYTVNLKYDQGDQEHIVLSTLARTRHRPR